MRPMLSGEQNPEESTAGGMEDDSSTAVGYIKIKTT
jgi:hypothetical protein